MCSSTQCALLHIKSSASCVLVHIFTLASAFLSKKYTSHTRLSSHLLHTRKCSYGNKRERCTIVGARLARAHKLLVCCWLVTPCILWCNNRFQTHWRFSKAVFMSILGWRDRIHVKKTLSVIQCHYREAEPRFVKQHFQ